MIHDTSQPLVPLTLHTKLLCFDVETNGLHGEGFAVGAVLLRLDGEVVDEFMARCPIEGEVDEWVRKHVLPPMAEFAQTHANAKELRDAFWQWFAAAKEQADYVLVDNGYPVEARFLIQCQEDDLDGRYWGHPYPLLELNSLLIQAGIKPLAVRYKLVEDQLQGEIRKHNPRFDAEVSARTAIHALRLTGRLAD